MSFSEFLSTFDLASKLVVQNVGDTPDVRQVLVELRRRAETQETNPLVNRDLIIEPFHEAQALEVPIETVESIASELHVLSILHVWARATCPSSSQEGLIIVETNNGKEFRETLDESCPHCGQMHDDLDWEYLETFYAFNFGLKRDTFSVARLFKPRRVLPSLTGSQQSVWDRGYEFLRSRVIKRFFRSGLRSPMTEVTEALESNQPPVQIPAPVAILRSVWKFAVGYVALCVTITGVVSVFNAKVAVVFSALFVAVFLVLSWITWKCIAAAAPIERRILNIGCTVACLCLVGSHGIGIKAIAGHPDMAVQGGGISGFLRNWGLELEFGEINPHLIWAGSLIFLSTLVAVAVISSRRLRASA